MEINERFVEPWYMKLGIALFKTMKTNGYDIIDCPYNRMIYYIMRMLGYNRIWGVDTTKYIAKMATEQVIRRWTDRYN